MRIYKKSYQGGAIGVYERVDKKIIFFVFLLSIFCGGCATVNVPNIGQQGYVLADDERRMQRRADSMCEILDDSGHIYQNKELEEYLTNFANGLLLDSVKKDNFTVRVSVLNDPVLNAFAFPNGRVFVHAGILATVDNEAQLAAILGHEMTHAVNRHALKQFRSLTNKTAFLAAMQVPLAAVGGNLGSLIAQLSIISSVYGYSRELENEADRQGFIMMQTKGYDTREAPKLFEHLRDFIEDEDMKEPFFFSTHPNVVARIENFNDLIKNDKNSQTEGSKGETSAYRQRVRTLVLDDVSLCLQLGMFKTAQRLVDRYIGENPDDAGGYFYRGELFRQRQDHIKKVKERDKKTDYPAAIEAYEKALSCDSRYAPAYREKARVLQKLGKTEEAKNFFRQYLDIDPSAKDKEYVEQFLSSH